MPRLAALGLAALAVLAVLVPLAPGVAVAQEPGPGQAVGRVACEGSSYSYACYLPRAYDASKPWPILYCFSPNANGGSFVNLFREGCEAQGWIVVASNDSKNGPLLTDAIEAMWTDTHRRFSIDDARVYASGFSGGSRVASWFASEKKGAGNVSIGGVYMAGQRTLPAIPYFLTCGNTDFNLREMQQAETQQKGAGHAVHLEVFQGGHTLPSRAIASQAIAWHQERWKEKAAAELAGKVEDLRSRCEDEPVAVYFEARDMAASYAGIDGVDALGDLMEELEDVEAVDAELDAMKALERTLERNERLRMPSQARTALRRVQQIAERYPETKAAERAATIIEELERVIAER